MSKTDYIDIVFDGPPSNKSGEFVEVENAAGKSVSVGEWIDRGDGFWALRIPQPMSSADSIRADMEQHNGCPHGGYVWCPACQKYKPTIKDECVECGSDT